MNHFMARLVFCFFAEDTDIFSGDALITKTVEQYSERDGSNTAQVLSEMFRSMNIKLTERATAQRRLPNWANGFPYVNGGLFSGSTEVPSFTRMARTYLLHAGNLNWQRINPDIFGSMIQAAADDEERGSLGMHYTSVPNILKVLNPLFLDHLRAQLDAAGDNKAKLLNLRKRMACNGAWKLPWQRRTLGLLTWLGRCSWRIDCLQLGFDSCDVRVEQVIEQAAMVRT